MNELDKTIDDCLKKAKKYDELAISYREIQDDYVRILGTDYKPDYRTSKECTMCASKNRQLAEWLKELKKYRAIFAKIGRTLYENGYTMDDLDTIWGKVNSEVNADDGI